MDLGQNQALLQLVGAPWRTPHLLRPQLPHLKALNASAYLEVQVRLERGLKIPFPVNAG